MRSFTHLSAGGSRKDEGAQPTASERRVKQLRLALYLGVAAVLTATGNWLLFLVLWIAPILLVLPMIMRIRSIAEHFALPNENPLNASRTIECGRFEAFFLAPHNVNLHLDHHLLAGVSFASLPELHDALKQQPEFRQAAHCNDGYFLGRQTLLHDMLGRSRSGARKDRPPRSLP